MDKTEKVQKCVMNLAACVQSAGGALSYELLNMTVIQFIEEIAAPNNITFVYSGKENLDLSKCCSICGKTLKSFRHTCKQSSDHCDIFGCPTCNDICDVCAAYN